MSLLVIEVLSEGIIFAADRNITLISNEDTKQVEQQAKVIKWAKNKAIVGYVGAATIMGMTTEEWLKSFISEFSEFQSFEEISKILSRRLEDIWKKEYSNSVVVPGLLIHIGGFEIKNGFVFPTVWFIRNVHEMSVFDYKNLTLEFKYSDEFKNIFAQRFSKLYPNRKIYVEEIRKILKVWSKQYNRFWFHHGFDLITFNVLQNSLESAFKLLVTSHPNHDFPKKLEIWEKHLRFQILMYGAYFQAFHEEGKHFVGGGVDVESIPWPD